MKNKNNFGNISCIDIYGNQLILSRGKKGKINFTLYHDEIIESGARKEFESVSLNITHESKEMFKITQSLYELLGDRFIQSTDPIRDGKNHLYLEKFQDSYYLTIIRDLSNDLNMPNQTNVEITGQNYEDLYIDVSNEFSIQLTKKRRLPL